MMVALTSFLFIYLSTACHQFLKVNVLTGLPLFPLLFTPPPGSGSLTPSSPPGFLQLMPHHLAAHPSAAASHFLPPNRGKAASVAV